jgi:hypothetical protein
LFWHTKALLDADDWQFGGFLLAIAGPVLLFFATSIMLTEPPAWEQAELKTFFDDLGRRFYLLFALVQLWIVLVSRSLNGSFVVSDLANAIFCVLVLVLAARPRRPFQVPGAFAAWGLGLASLAFQWVN